MPTTPVRKLPGLWTPEELEAEYAGRIKAIKIRRLVRAKRVVCTRGAKRAILFTDVQVKSLLAAMAEPAPAVAAPAA